MRRLIITIAAALACANAVFAVDWRINDIDVKVRLYSDGSAVVSETWDMSAHEGTEVYVPRQNLGDIAISRFSVMDETGAQYEYEDRWNTEWSMSRKAGRCGINRIQDGVELCWGIGSYGSQMEL